MEYKTAMEKMTFLMCGDDLCRIRTEQDEDGIVKVIIDLHGMSKRNAIRMITNIMVLFRFKFRLIGENAYPSNWRTFRNIIESVAGNFNEE